MFWQRWLEDNPEKRIIYEEAVTTFLVIQGDQNLISNQQVLAKKEEILSQLQSRKPRIIPFTVKGWGLAFSAAAAAVILILFGGNLRDIPQLWSEMLSQFMEAKQDEIWNSVDNKTDSPMVVLLPDHSSVILSPGSNLRYLKAFRAAKREVYLEGEGFFEVVRDPSKPFLVYTNSLTTKVLGTSFTIRSFKNENTSFVKVNTGKVAVFPVVSTRKSVLLSRNEQFNLEIKKKKIVRQQVIAIPENAPENEEEQFQFDYAPLPEVFGQLQETYNVEILYDPQSISDCTFTGKLNGLPLLEKIKLICLATDSTYEIKDRTIVIHSTGCH